MDGNGEDLSYNCGQTWLGRKSELGQLALQIPFLRNRVDGSQVTETNQVIVRHEMTIHFKTAFSDNFLRLMNRKWGQMAGKSPQ